MQLNNAGIKRQNEILGRRAVIVAGSTAFALAVVKFAAGLIGGSVAVLGSAIDSMLDLLVSALNFFAIRKSQAAPNAKFNFGYAKLEALAAMFEGVLIVGAGAFIFYESVRKLQTEQAPVDTAFSLYAMALSVAVTGLLVAYLSRVARRTRNLIVRADALHYKSDLFSNLAVIASLILVEFTGFAEIDAVFGIVISGYIAVSAINLMKESVGVLLDRALDPEITAQIEEIIRSRPQITSYHGLATRKSANIYYVAVHLVFNREISLYDAHKISDEIEAAIRAKYGEFEWQITTHLDPCDDQNGSCEC